MDMTTTIKMDKRKYHLQTEMINWCKQQFGSGPYPDNWVYSEPGSWEGLGNWCISTGYGNSYFHFKNESDAIIFALRWE